jgi:multidrug efflux pump subunit AcrB
MEGVYQVSCDHVRGKSELRVSLKPEARHFGLDVERLARQLYGGFFGEEAVRLQRGKDDVKVKVRYPAEERSRISHLRDLFVTAPDGRRIPLSTVAEIQRADGFAAITRKDGKRCLVVSAALDENKTQTEEVLSALETSFFSGLKMHYPGVEWLEQGMEETEDEAFGSLFVGFPLAMGVIYMMVAGFLRSYSQPLVILFTVPFGIIGAILGHFALGHHLSLFSVFGMVALAGVVVNDAIVLIHRLNKNLEEGMPFRDALTRAARRRFRAIFLTSISTVGGLAPLILEKSLEAQWLIPMAISIAAGVTFATALTLILIPCLLSIVHDLRKTLC